LVTWAKDSITATTANVCGDYSIEVEFDSDASDYEGGPIDPALTDITITAGNTDGI